MIVYALGVVSGISLLAGLLVLDRAIALRRIRRAPRYVDIPHPGQRN